VVDEAPNETGGWTLHVQMPGNTLARLQREHHHAVPA